MKTKIKPPKKPVKLSKGLNPKTPTSANPECETLEFILHHYLTNMNI